MGHILLPTGTRRRTPSLALPKASYPKMHIHTVSLIASRQYRAGFDADEICRKPTTAQVPPTTGAPVQEAPAQ